MPSNASEGHCATCGAPIDITKIWCDVHRKTGRKPGLFGGTYEKDEQDHGDRVRDYHRWDRL